MVHHDGAHEGSLGSAPAPGAVFRALAENAGRTKIFQTLMTVPRATAEREARSDTPGAGVLPGPEATRPT
jgi:hypothetical protein